MLILSLFHIALYLKQQRVMKPTYSLNIIDQSQQHIIDQPALASIPPGSDKQSISGLFTLNIETKYINTYRQSIAMRCKLWGGDGDYLHLRKVNETSHILNLNIRSSLQNISKYFADMQVMCIQLLVEKVKQKSMENIVNRSAKEFKHIGWIFINFKRYLINNILNQFQEEVNIIDLKKQKLGQALGKVSLQFYPKQTFFPNPTQPIIKPISSLNNSIPTNYNQQINHYQKNPVQHPYISKQAQFPSKVSFESHNPIFKAETDNRVSFQEMVSMPIKEQDEKEYSQIWIPNVNKKGKAMQFLQEYNKNKPQHSELSVIRQKYGNNYPSVQIMKLKYDQANLLSSHIQSENKNNQQRLNLLLKYCKLEGKAKIQNLVVHCQQSQNKIKTQTKIFLNDPSNSKIDINYLMILPKYSPNDILIFQSKQAKVQINIEELKKKSKLQLKHKSSGKIIAQIQYDLISEEFVGSALSKKGKENVIEEQKKPILNNNQLKEKQHKQKISAYVNIINWPQDKIKLKNKDIGTVNASKVIFEVSKNQSQLDVQLTKQNQQKILINIELDHIFKQQNFMINGRSVKIISSKGPLNQILSLIKAIEPQQIQKQQNYQQPQSDKQEHQAWNLKDLIVVFEALQNCQNQECNQLMQILQQASQLNYKKLQRLSSLLKLDANILKIIILKAFSNQFVRFSKSFHAYHCWNHKYKVTQKKVQKMINSSIYCSDLERIVKRLKKSGQVMFGVLKCSSFISQFSKLQHFNDRVGTEQIEQQLDKEELSKLIILLLERYSNRTLKISQLFNFITNKETCNLNSFQLSKITQEINNQHQHFQQLLNQNDDIFIITLINTPQVEGEQGLAKLLLTGQEYLTQSSILGNQQQFDHKQTQNQQEIRQINFNKTEESKQAPKVTQKSILKQQIKQITIVLSYLIIPNLQDLSSIKISSQNSSIILQKQDLIFPQAIVLPKGIIHNIVVKAGQNYYEGVFITSEEPKNVKLYELEKEVGVFRIFTSQQQQKKDNEEQIMIQVTSTDKREVKQNIQPLQYLNREEILLKNSVPTAKSPFVKITIRSIRPSRINFKLGIRQMQEKIAKLINFPNQNQFLIKNNEQGWKLSLIGQNLQQITLLNHVTSNTHCFSDNQNNKVAYIAVIELEQCWDTQVSLDPHQSLNIFIHVDNIVSLQPLEIGNYELIFENQTKNIKICAFDVNLNRKKVGLFSSFSLTQIPEKFIIKLIKVSPKQMVGSFKFALKISEQSVNRHNRSLISQQAGLRLQITIFQVRYIWDHCKPDKIFKIFSSEGRKSIQRWSNAAYNINEDELIYWLKSNFQLTLGQIDILLQQLFNSGDDKGWKQFLLLFRIINQCQIKDLAEVMQQFHIFDLNQNGMIIEDKLKIIKKILQRNFKDMHTLLEQKQKNYSTSPQIINNAIIDLSPSLKASYFDYLSFINSFEPILAKLPGPKLLQNQKQKLQKNKQSNKISVKLSSFDKLSINGAPCTLMFKIKGQQLADPIPRCYSYKFGDPHNVIVDNSQNIQVQILCQKLNREGLWEYKSIEKLPLNKEIKTLGGTINFQIQPFLQNIGNKYKSLKKEQAATPLKFNNKQIQQPQYDEQKLEFPNSFWNRSLNQTKQKWARSQWGKTGQKQIKKPFQVDKDELQKKLNIFDQDWQ